MAIPNYRVFFKTEVLSMSSLAGLNKLELTTKCNQIKIWNELMLITTGNFSALNLSNLVFQFAPRVEGVSVKPKVISTLVNPTGTLEPLRFNDEFVLEAPDQAGIIDQKIKVEIQQDSTSYASSLVIVRRYIEPI